MNLSKCLLIGFLMSLLAGCEVVHPNRGVQIDLYPVTNQLTLNISNVKEAKSSVHNFLKQHQKDLFTATFNITYKTAHARKLALRTRSDLIKRGVDPSAVIVLKESNQEMQFVLQMVTVLMKNSPCPDISYRSYNSNKNKYGCTVETNRWKSMVHPERAAGLVK
ncbi:hypothetical protein [Vibrio tritonius]|uniref:hypothetical protein n=1 Tax=Vibrio tritonius TaxID=1435069 RepID=UPI00315D845B